MNEEKPVQEPAEEPTDVFFREALAANEINALREIEVKILHRMLPNIISLQERAMMIFAAIERKALYLQSQESSRINRWIAYATIATVISGIFFGIWQSTNTTNQIALQRQELQLEYRPFIGTYTPPEDSIPYGSSTSVQKLSKTPAGCNFHRILFDKETTSTVFSIPIKNYGKTPARYHLGGLNIKTPSSTRELGASLLTLSDGYLMPGENLTVKYQVLVEDLRVEAWVQVNQIEYVTLIRYQGLRDDNEYTTRIAVKPKPMQISSNIYCAEIVNDESD